MMDFVLDVKEKEVGIVQAPAFPQPSSNTSGFPEHKKRSKASAFRQKRQGNQHDGPMPKATGKAAEKTPNATSPLSNADFEAQEKRRIDQENTDRLASMSPEEIEEARKELLSSLDPALVQMLLRRATLDQPDPTSPFKIPQAKEAKGADANEAASPKLSPPDIKVTDASKSDSAGAGNRSSDRPSDRPISETKPPPAPHVDEDAPPKEVPDNAFPITDPAPSHRAEAPAKTVHFPSAPSAPDLDPSDPDFLTSLHDKFFPNLAADPSKLAWMAPVPTPDSPADRDSPYYPGQSSLPVAALRFDFGGRLLPPGLSRAIPATAGLHHHGEAPEAAGYTVMEMARLARSAVPAQRCIAFRTLGRILFRLGRGEWGRGDSDLAMGLWGCFREGRVLETLIEAAGQEHGHRTTHAFAVEALWLFEKGGWKQKTRGR